MAVPHIPFDTLGENLDVGVWICGALQRFSATTRKCGVTNRPLPYGMVGPKASAVSKKDAILRGATTRNTIFRKFYCTPDGEYESWGHVGEMILYVSTTWRRS